MGACVCPVCSPAAAGVRGEGWRVARCSMSSTHTHSLTHVHASHSMSTGRVYIWRDDAFRATVFDFSAFES